jgi:hypothetical protein
MHRLRSTLVVAEMALAVILLTGAGLLIRSFIALTQVNPGFQPGGAITLRVTLQGAEYKTSDQIRNRVEQLITRVRALPQVTAVGVGSILPLGGLGALNDFAVEGGTAAPPDVNQEIAVAGASPDYFKAIGAPLIRGRMFSRSRSTQITVGRPAQRSRREESGSESGSDRDERCSRAHRLLAKSSVSSATCCSARPGEPAVAQMFRAVRAATGAPSV